MPENRNSCSRERENVCIDTKRILDSCRDKDCYEDVRVYLSDCGQSMIEKTNNLRVKEAKIACCQIGLDPVPFHCGFYQVTIRFYVKLCMEGCVSMGRPQDFCGIAVTEKKVILYGSEGNVNIFHSDPEQSGFCSCAANQKAEHNLPMAVCEVADPVVLDLKVAEPQMPCCSCCCAADVRDQVGEVDGFCPVDDEDGKHLLVTLGFFSVVRIERPGQFMINASEHSIPEKECLVASEDDPCSIFKKMDFPVGAFAPPPYPNRRNCGCD